MKILQLPLKKEWYEMIESGVKTEEYREIKPHWIRRFFRHPDGNKINNSDAEYYARNIDILISAVHEGIIRYVNYTHTKFSYGYTKRTMTFGIDSFRIGKGKSEWGAPNEDVFIFKLY
jgi:hypothetical protein